MSSQDGTSAPLPVITNFYVGKSVFITGGMGFLGKVLIYKLLTGCPDIKYIFILVNESRGEEETIHTLFSADLVFSELQVSIQRREELFDKIKFIIGDYTQDLFGINFNSPIGILMKQEVSLVFHLAGTSQLNFFREPSLSSNYVSLLTSVRVCRQLNTMPALIYVSTTRFLKDKFVAEDLRKHNNIEQAVRGDMRFTYKVLEEDISGWPDMNTFTKHMGEAYLRDIDIPAVIVRSGILGGAAEEPFAGYVENTRKKPRYRGFTGVVACIMKGLLRKVRGNANKFVPLVPVDYLANTLIVSGWYISSPEVRTGTKDICPRGEFMRPDLVCMNYMPSPLGTNLLTWAKIQDHLRASIKKFPTVRALCHYSFEVNDSRRFRLRCILKHWYPGFILWCFQWLNFASWPFCKSRCCNLLCCDQICCSHDLRNANRNRIKKEMYWLSQSEPYFTALKDYSWDHYVGQAMVMNYSIRDPSERDKFQMDLELLRWKKYFDYYVRGVRKHFLNDYSDYGRARVNNFNLQKTYETYYWILAILIVITVVSLFITFVKVLSDPNVKFGPAFETNNVSISNLI